ncbi:uncharacterized protein [Lepisosteus oculatus]|uniref:uncharacterized protein n=1 Tax=Lepisosteus oculatus TaxID=7918 RepID=UPI00371AF971
MGIRAGRLQQDVVPAVLEKEGITRESYRRARSKRPTSLVVDFPSRFDREPEPDRSGSDPAAGSPGEPVRPDLLAAQDRDDKNNNGSGSGHSPDPGRLDDSAAAAADRRLSVEETGRVSHQLTFSERLPVGRHVAARSSRVRGSQARPVSEAWVGVYRVPNRHGALRCPFCTKTFPPSRFEEHLLSCLTAPSLPYNTDILTRDSGECSICLEDLLQGQTISRLACLCVYHKSCIDSWCKVKSCCPEHPFD